MRRREFIGFIGSAAAWPLAARAQQGAMPVIGFFRSTPAEPFANLVIAFHQGLKEMGFVEGQNVAVEQRWADNQLDRLPDLAADLVRRQVAVIVGNGPGSGCCPDRHHDHPNRVRNRRRSGGTGPCRQLQSASRQPDGPDVLRQPA